MKTIVKTRFGSDLYGTVSYSENGERLSDMDFKGIFMPSKEQIFLGHIPKSYNETTKKGSAEKNTKDDVDTEMYSLHYFLKLACEGQTVAIDMLHAPDNMILESSEIWEEIRSNKKLFYTKNLKAFIGYARRQAAKYGVKGSRLSAAEKVIDLLRIAPQETRLKEIWNYLPEEEHLHMLEKTTNDLRQYQVCGRILQETMTVEYALSIIQKFYDAYGERAKMAAENKFIDWKAVSHAIRAAYQVKELLLTGDIIFPLWCADLLKKIKLGELDYTTKVAPLLEELMEEAEELSAKSSLPDKVNRKFWDKFLIKTIEKEYDILKERIKIMAKKRTIPASNFIKVIAANIDNKKLSDKEFREFIRSTLPIVIYKERGVHKFNDLY